MTSASTCTEGIEGRRQQTATRLVFFISGLGLAAWAPLVPFAKDRLGIGEGVLGLLLLCLGAGSILAMPVTGPLVTRLGCRRVIVACTGLFCLALPLMAGLSNIPGLVAALFLFGIGIGSVDVAMNMQAIVVERASGRSMMSGFHGLFSLGAIVGAAGMTLMLSLAVSPLEATFCVVALIVLGLLLAMPNLLTAEGRDDSTSDGPAFALPRGIVIIMGLVCFVSFLSEGAMLDWTAVFLISNLDVAAAHAGLGFAAFSVTMTLGRLLGDRVVARLGGPRVVMVGGFLAAAGMLLTVFAPVWTVALIGCALIGAGCANIVPVMFTSVGRQTVMPEHTAVPAMATMGYMGVLVGPAGIGFLAEATSLSTSFFVLAVMLVGAGLSSRVLRD
ncbi:MFS transporter [Marinobacter fonticola]|uniref:MFS transporter n=1 Tax=Marinobacter fonticola TaxID=2603215 RepID=UPI0011E8899D|nr:MFS transporter [Marinobacter fonticola]